MRHTARTKRVQVIHRASPLLLVIMLTHTMAASVPGNMYVMDSGAEEHVSREVDIFTNVNTGACVLLQTVDGTQMKAHGSGTVRGLQQAVGVHNLTLPS